MSQLGGKIIGRRFKRYRNNLLITRKMPAVRSRTNRQEWAV